MNLAGTAGLVLFALGGLIVLANLHVSFVAPLLDRLRSRERRFVSAIPVIGSFMLVLAFLLLPSGHALRLPAVIGALLDPGGLLLAAVALARAWWTGRHTP